MPLTLPKNCVHSCILENETTHKLAKFGANKPLLNITPLPIHIAQPFLALQNPYKTNTLHPLDISKSYIQKEYIFQLMTTILPQCPYLAKWLNNPVVHFSLSNHLCLAPH